MDTHLPVLLGGTLLAIDGFAAVDASGLLVVTADNPTS